MEAAEFKATCSDLLDRVCCEGVSVEIAMRGTPVAVLSPFEAPLPPLFGSAPVRIVGDIIGPS